MKYSIGITGYSLSDSADGAQRPINHDEVNRSKFLHIGILANVPKELTSLEGKFRAVPAAGAEDPSADRPLPPAKEIRDGQFEVILTHYVLEAGTTYLIRLADKFQGDTKCLCSGYIRTLR